MYITDTLPSSNPWFRVHAQPTCPHVMFLRPCWKCIPLFGKLLCNCPDVVRFKPTTASDKPNAHIV